MLAGILIFSFLGFLDASYLSIKHFQGLPPDCYLLQGCDVVTSSKYSVFFGVPLAYLGFIYYLIIFISTILYLDTKDDRFLKFILGITFFGLLASIWFTYLQFFVIKSICIYCLTSAVFTVALFVLSGLSVVNIENRPTI